MTKLCKKLLLVCLTVLSVVCLGLFAACVGGNGGNNDTPVTYTVTVVDENDAPVQGVSVYLKKGSTRYDAVTSGEDGVVTTELAADTYEVGFVASTIPAGYEAPENLTVTKDAPSVTAKLIKKLRYVVTLVKEDGTAFYHENVYVALCEVNGNCLTPSPLGTDGTWAMENIEAKEYKVQINLPADVKDSYTFKGNTADKHYYTGKHVTATDTEVTIEIKALNTLALTTEMTADEEAAYATGFSQFENSTKPAKYSFNSVFKANETKYFKFNPYKTSDFVFFCKNAGATFDFEDDSYTVETNLAQGVNATKNKEVYFSVTAATAGTVTFVIAGPDTGEDSSTVTFTDEGTKEVKIVSAEKYATVIFTAEKTGVYEITSEGDYDTKVEYYANSFKVGEEDEGGEGQNFKYSGIEIQQVGPTFEFRVFVKESATFPVTLNVKITRTGDAEVIVERETQKVTATQVGQTAYEAAGKFTEVDLDTPQTVVLGNDGYYHLDEANGPVLVVKLNKAFRDNFGIFTAENTMGRAANPQFMWFADYASETINWDYLDFLKAYQAKCNADGVYGVNAELKLMLERWAGARINEYTLGIDNLGTIAEGNEWLIPCGYYVVTQLTGEGTEDSAYSLGYGEYEINLPAETTVYFMMTPGEYTVTVKTTAALTFSADVTATETEGGYKFDCVSSMMLGLTSFTVTNEGASAVSVKFVCSEQVKEAGNELELGMNEVTIAAEEWSDGKTFTFTPEEDGRYVISSASADASLYGVGDTVYEEPTEYGFAITIDAEAGETYSILLGCMEFSGATYTIVINKELEAGENEVEIFSENDLYDGTVFGFSTTEAGKYVISCPDQYVQLLFVEGFNGYNGDLQMTGFAFILDAEEFTDYYFVVITDDTNNFFITVAKYSDVSLTVGDNDVSASFWGNVYAFTATEDATYTITSTDEDAAVLAGYDWATEGEVDITIQAQAGKTYYFIFAVNGMDDNTYKVTVTKSANSDTAE